MALIWENKSEPTPTEETASMDKCLLPRDLSQLPSNAAIRHEAMLINEISLVLSEKRTSLSVMRTGLAIIALPISVFSVLIVISRYYDPLKVMYLLGPLLGVCAILTILGAYLIFVSFRRIFHLNKVTCDLKKQNSTLRELCLAMDDTVKPDKDF